MIRFSTVRFSLLLIMLSLAGASLAAKAPPKPDMQIVLDDGREVVLRPDSTWEFAKPSFLQEEMDDIYMDLDDGRILCIKNDNTWLFVSKRPPKTKMTFSEVPSVSTTATATNKALDAAVQSAKKQVFDRAATRLLSYAKKSKMTQQYLVACIKDEVGEAAAEVAYKPGWTATAKLSLDKVQVNKILECVTLQVDAGTGIAPDASAKDTAK